jgi:hypothetical protein
MQSHTSLVPCAGRRALIGGSHDLRNRLPSGSEADHRHDRILHDADFERFQANLDWLETTGVLVEQFDLSTAQGEIVKRPAVRQILSDEGEQALPLILVNEAVVSEAGICHARNWRGLSGRDKGGSGRRPERGRH